jgi:hypothetical protein
MRDSQNKFECTAASYNVWLCNSIFLMTEVSTLAVICLIYWLHSLESYLKPDERA